MYRITESLSPVRSKEMGSERSLHLQRPFGKTLILTLVMILLLIGALELMARQDAFQALLAEPRLSSRHYQLGRKVARLDTIIKNEGAVDCIMIGSSMVDVGFDPPAFEESYQQISGQNIRCFNFGIDASTAASAAALARILIEDYHPRLLIYGTDARDYAVPLEDNDPAVILESNWVQYRSGNFSFDGWLTEYSYLYRYKHHLYALSRFHTENILRTKTKLNFEIASNGFTPLTTVGTYINDPPNPRDDSFEVTYYGRIFSAYEMLPENLDALEQIARYNEQETQVIIVEMPVAKGLQYFFGNGLKDQEYFATQVENIARIHQVPFWRTNGLALIADEGWVDYSHLNVTGAQTFSHWLGQKVGEAASQGPIK